MFQKKTKVILIAVSSLLLLLILAFTALLLSTKSYTNKSLPTQNYASTSLSKQSIDTINDQINLANTKLSQKSIKFKFGEETKVIFLSELDPTFINKDISSKVRYYKGTPSPLQLLKDIFVFENLKPSVEFSEEEISNQLVSKFEGLYPSENPFFQSEDNISTEKTGVLPNTKQIVDILTAGEIPSTIEITSFQDKPTLTKADVEKYYDKVKFISENPINLYHQDKEYKLSLFDHIDKIKFTKSEEEIQVSLDQDFASEYIHFTIQPEVKKEPTPLTISINKETNRAEFSEDSEEGLDVDKQLLLQEINNSLQTAFITQKTQGLTIPTIAIEPTLNVSEELKQRGIKELVGTGFTTFRGSTRNRIHNINVGVNKFNGMIIPKGEEFSFNDNLGPVDGSTGYKPELVIKPHGTIPEYGGGLCQVSSTMYRAALFSGLDITERSNHSYAVGYYAQVLGHGLDATIYPGVKDLKFLNNTDGDIIVQAYTEGTSATFKFYGTKMIEKVELVDYANYNYRSPGPKTITIDPSLPSGTIKYLDSPVTGFDSYWKRVIYYKDNTTKEEDIYSKYRAVNAKWIVPADYYSSQSSTEDSEPSS